MATLVVGCCFGHAFFHVSAFTADRVLVAVILCMYLAARWLYGLPAKRFVALDVAVMLLTGILTMSTFAHAWKIDDAQPFSLIPVKEGLFRREGQARASVAILPFEGYYMFQADEGNYLRPIQGIGK